MFSLFTPPANDVADDDDDGENIYPCLLVPFLPQHTTATYTERLQYRSGRRAGRFEEKVSHREGTRPGTEQAQQLE